MRLMDQSSLARAERQKETMKHQLDAKRGLENLQASLPRLSLSLFLRRATLLSLFLVVSDMVDCVRFSLFVGMSGEHQRKKLILTDVLLHLLRFHSEQLVRL